MPSSAHLRRARSQCGSPADTRGGTLDIAFTDAAGTHWLRTEDGTLQMVEDTFEFPDVDERLVDPLVPLRAEHREAL